MNRRTFIERSALAAGALSLPSLISCSSTAGSPIGIQLYTVKDIFTTDVKGTLKLVAETGFKEVEAFGYEDGKIFGVSYSEFASEVKRLGMKVISGHYGTGQTNPEKKGTPTNDWERSVNDAKSAGQKYMTIAWMDEAERNTLDALKRTCEILNKAGEVTKKYDLRMAYHNHAFEFTKLDDQVMYDVMLKELDPSLVAMEMDIYWVVFAGQDPLTYFKNYPGRFELWHVKDMDKSDRSKNSDVGSGTIDFKPIFAAADQAGMKHFFMEQEYFEKSSTESIKHGFSYLKSIL